LLLQSKAKEEQKEILLNSEFLEWFAGFTDAEGNFHLTFSGLCEAASRGRKLNENNYTSAMLTFQIGLHIDDLFILEYIKNKLNCGHISISLCSLPHRGKRGNKCNYFINDKNSLLQILLPIFNFTKLNSSKYHQFILFTPSCLCKATSKGEAEKVVNFIKDKNIYPLAFAFRFYLSKTRLEQPLSEDPFCFGHRGKGRRSQGRKRR
jgi:hypothetical protein